MLRADVLQQSRIAMVAVCKDLEVAGEFLNWTK